MKFTIKTPAEQDAMRRAGRMAADLLDFIEPQVQPGITTDELNHL
ncbi:MAG: type I methionyl aminopeptidase, partial [Steroidobacteraceae bacterium]